MMAPHVASAPECPVAIVETISPAAPTRTAIARSHNHQGRGRLPGIPRARSQYPSTRTKNTVACQARSSPYSTCGCGNPTRNANCSPDPRLTHAAAAPRPAIRTVIQPNRWMRDRRRTRTIAPMAASGRRTTAACTMRTCVGSPKMVSSGELTPRSLRRAGPVPKSSSGGRVLDSAP